MTARYSILSSTHSNCVSKMAKTLVSNCQQMNNEIHYLLFTSVAIFMLRSKTFQTTLVYDYIVLDFNALKDSLMCLNKHMELNQRLEFGGRIFTIVNIKIFSQNQHALEKLYLLIQNFLLFCINHLMDFHKDLCYFLTYLISLHHIISFTENFSSTVCRWYIIKSSKYSKHH